MTALPEGYVAPVLIWCVETEFQGEVTQLGAFFDEDAARQLLERLEGEGRHAELHLNLIAVHERVVDWEWDR